MTESFKPNLDWNNYIPDEEDEIFVSGVEPGDECFVAPSPGLAWLSLPSEIVPTSEDNLLQTFSEDGTTTKSLPPWLKEFIAHPPKPGGGLHQWILNAAIRLVPYRPESWITSLLQRAVDNCGEPRDPNEVKRAVGWAKNPESNGAFGRSSGKGKGKKRRSRARRVEFDKELRDAIANAPDAMTVDGLIVASPVSIQGDRGVLPAECLRKLFPPGCLICAATELSKPQVHPLEEWCDVAHNLQFIVPNTMTDKEGLTQDGRPSSRCLSNVGNIRFLVIEADIGTLDEQAAVIWYLGQFLPLVMVMFSGNKSLHAWFFGGFSEEKELHEFMDHACMLGADNAMRCRCQFARFPGGRRPEKDGSGYISQKIYYFDPEAIALVRPYQPVPVLTGSSTPSGTDKDDEDHLIPASIIEELEGKTEGSYDEEEFAKALLMAMPPFFADSDRWFVWNDREWTIQSKESFLPMALELLERASSAKIHHATQLLKHVGGLRQSTRQLYGCYRKIDGEVLLNLQDGVLCITPTHVTLKPHDPVLGFAFTIPTAWDGEAQCPVFLKVLADSLPDYADQELFRLFMGSVLEPDSRLETALVLFGESGTGKSTLVDSVAHALGRGKAVSNLSMKSLCDTKEYGLHQLKYALLNLVTEGDALEVQESSNFKTIVSGESLHTREIYQAPETIKPTVKIVIASNVMPRFRFGTDAERRRLRMLHFTVKPGRPDPSLKRRLEGEAAGVLRWMVESLQEVLMLDQMPQGGEEAAALADRFALSNDLLGEFVKRHCVVGRDKTVVKSELLAAFNTFAEDNGADGENENWFFRKLAHMIPSIDLSGRHKKIRVAKGIALKEPEKWKHQWAPVAEA